MSRHADELSRALSNINLHTLAEDIERRVDVRQPYAREELLSLRQVTLSDDTENGHGLTTDGFMSPDSLTVPPPTPDHPPSPIRKRRNSSSLASPPTRCTSPVRFVDGGADEMAETSADGSKAAREGSEVNEDGGPSVGDKKKRKKRKKSSGKNRLPPATGFEGSPLHNDISKVNAQFLTLSRILCRSSYDSRRLL